MARQLKVFSTPAGFVNAVVAVPSQKAALEAWGVRDNLFATGAATVVTDPELIAQALATPGEILRVPISTDAGFVAAAKAPAASKPEASASRLMARPSKAAPPRPPLPSPPPPDRSPLTRTERALVEVQAHQRAALAELDAERDAYERRRAKAETALNQAVAEAERARDAAQKAFRAAGGQP